MVGFRKWLRGFEIWLFQQRTLFQGVSFKAKPQSYNYKWNFVSLAFWKFLAIVISEMVSLNFSKFLLKFFIFLCRKIIVLPIFCFLDISTNTQTHIQILPFVIEWIYSIYVYFNFMLFTLSFIGCFEFASSSACLL